MPRQIGWSNESNLLYNISQQLDRLAAVTAASAGGGGTIAGSIGTGQVAFGTAADTIGGSNNLFWDSTNSRLGIGTNTPSTALHVIGDLTIRGSGATSGSFGFTLLKSNGQGTLTIRNDGFGILYGNLQLATALPYLQLTPSAWGSSFYLQSGVNIAANAAGDYTVFLSPVNRGYAFIQGSTASMVIAPTTSNVSIGTTSDLGVRLGVVGDTLLRGSGSTNTTTALTVQNSSSTNLLRVLNNGDVSFSADAMFWDATNGRLGIGTNTPSQKLVIYGGASTGQIKVGFAENANWEFGRSSSTGDFVMTNNIGASAIQGFRITQSTARFIIGGGTDTTEKLQVYGNAKIVTSSNVIPLAIGGYSLTGSNSFTALEITGTWNTSGTPTAIFLNITNTTSNNASKLIDLQINSSSVFNIDRIGRAVLNGLSFTISNNIFLSSLQTSIASSGLVSTSNVAITSGITSLVKSSNNFVPTSGNGEYISYISSPIINQAGGANGITRGLYVNPTLTSAFDWRSVETANNTGWAIYAGGTAPSLFNGDVSIAGKLALTVTANRQTVNYSLVLADNGKLVEMNVGAANTLTVPPNSSIAFPIGTKIDIAQYGAGQTSIVPGAGVTVRSALGALKLAAQYSGASLVKIGTDEWYLFGDITV